MKNFFKIIKNKFCCVFILNFFLAFYSITGKTDNLEKGNFTIQSMIVEAKKHAIETIELKPEERSLKIKVLINKYTNLDFMAKATTGNFWKNTTKIQKEKYKSALLNQIVKTVEEHLNKLSTLSYIPLDSELRGKRLVYVRGLIEDPKKKQPAVNLLWKLAADKTGNFLVLDLEIEGISLISSHKAETMSILRKNRGDFEKLLSKLNVNN